MLIIVITIEITVEIDDTIMNDQNSLKTIDVTYTMMLYVISSAEIFPAQKSYHSNSLLSIVGNV